MSAASATAESDLQSRIAAYLQGKLPRAEGLRLHKVERIAVGWSHETWLFDAEWQEAGQPQRQGMCLRRDPGNALLRHLSDLGQQFRVLKALESTPLAAPRVWWYESDPAILDAPFLVMEKVPGSCPSPWGREGRAFYQAAAERGELPRSFTQTLATLHTLDWRAAGLDGAFVPLPGHDHFSLLDELSGPEGILARALARLAGR